MKAKSLKFVKLDAKILRIVIFINSSFANNKNLLSQIDYIIVLANARNNVNIIY